MESRLQRLRDTLSKKGIAAFWIEDPVHIFYLTGLTMSLGKLIITDKHFYMIADGRYLNVCKKKSFLTVIELKDDTLPEKFDELHFIEDKTTYERFVKLSQQTTPVPSTDHVLDQRAIKDQDEIALLKQAGELGSAGYDHVLTLLKPGVTEKEVASQLEIFWKQHHADGISFEPIIAFGENTAYPHYSPGDVPLKKGDPVLIDIGVSLNRYASDMTRVVFFGDPDPKLAEIYEIVKEAQAIGVEKCVAGATCGSVDQAVRDFITDAGYGEAFNHGLGHGVGLDVHELPVLKNKAPYDDTILEPGMVITVEPGIYLPGIGGVRLEDTVIVTDSNPIDLTNRSK